MKKLSFKITSFLLAFTMLFSTLSFSVDKHYCGNQLFSESIFSHARDCGMQQMNLCDKKATSNAIKSNGCCHNVQVFIQGQNLEQKALTAIALELSQVALIVDFKAFNFEQAYQHHPVAYQNYTPPLLVNDIPVLVQSFLI